MGRRKTSQTDVPPPEDPDRKRVLNVLAQRRYRQRQRNRLVELERKANLISTGSDRHDSKSLSPTSDGHEKTSNGSVLEVTGSPSPTTNLEDTENASLWPSTILTYPWASTSNDSLAVSRWIEGNSHLSPTYNDDASNSAMELQDLETSQFQFPDDAILDVSELKVVRASFEIAILLQCENMIWNVKAIRTFNSTTSPDGSQLPRSFLPTEEQKRIPHHPVFDLLPWPAVRSKLIRVFNRAPNIRPPVARDALAVMKLLQDMEAPAEGLRVNGGDGFDAENWEVGQQFFANWWWALECSVIERSSALRVLRGAESLHVEG